ncbi:hypothetical protein AGMMS50268_28950 [Spirochaetia bacterium]|nr:hypothetical protein AGMMS50268_28950 [Spirochaetia bacterium]
MSGIPVYLYPLQLPQFWKEDNPLDSVIFGISVAVVVTIFIIFNIFKNKGKFNTRALGASGFTARPTTAHRKFSGFALHRLAHSAGLDRTQTKMLDYVFKVDGVSDPEQSFHTPALLDRHFKHAYRAIERGSPTEAEAQQKLGVLFSTRNILEASAVSGSSTTSTRGIADSTPAVIKVGTDSYPTKVISAKGETLVMENPKNAVGTSVRLPRNSKVTLSFFTHSSRGFSVETRVLGSAEAASGPRLQLIHSSQIKYLAQRRFRRRQMVLSTTFYFIHIEDTGGKKEKKMVADKRKLTGSIMDISIGGCSIKTNIAVSSGTRLKIEFSPAPGQGAAVIGQVLRTNRSGANTIMHVKFLRAPRRSMNAINALVFEYTDG